MAKVNNNGKNTFALNLASYRKKMGLTQQEMGLRVSEYLQRSVPYGVPTISCWETGRKVPPEKVVKAFAEIFGLTLSEMYGYALAEETESTETAKLVRKLAPDALSSREILDYDKKPLFAVFPMKEYEDQWVILNYQKNRLVTANGYIPLDAAEVQLFPFEAYDYPAARKRKGKPVSAMVFQTLKEKFWVEVVSSDDSVRAMYDGWYIRNANGQAIVNIANGLILPARGFAISYKVYKEPYDVI